MELNFDKEIDALLRQAAKSESFAGANGSDPLAHIDADTLSAFAENALPEKTRALYMTHLGDCDRCRKILSNLITLNSEPWPPATSSIETPEIAIAPIPWYRSLFIFPNLAYTMGALVLVFSGMLGFVIVRNLGDGATTQVSQVSNQEIARPAAAPQPESATANTNAASAPSANSSANASATPPVNPGMDFDPNTTGGETEIRENDSKLSGRDEAASQPAASATPADDIRTERDDGVSQPKEQKPETVASTNEKKNEDRLNAANPAPPPPAPVKSGPYGGLVSKKDAEAGRAQSDATESGSRKRLAGKSFNRRDGVWYDSAYSTQPVTSVRRNTDEYRKLDSSVRSIGDSLSGTVVVVWKERAYRIQ